MACQLTVWLAPVRPVLQVSSHLYDTPEAHSLDELLKDFLPSISCAETLVNCLPLGACPSSGTARWNASGDFKGKTSCL